MKWKLALTALLLALAVKPSHAQIKQSGTVTPRHVGCWTSTGVLQDCGTAAIPFASSFGVVNNGGPGICVNSAATTGPYNQICFAVTTNGGAKISSYAYGGATTPGLVFDLNGSVQGFPLVQLPVAAGSGTCFLNTTGALTDCGFTPLSSVLPSAQIFVGNSSNVAQARAVTGVISLTNTGVTSFTNGSTGTGAVVLQTAPTFITSITDPLVIGGTGIGSSLTLQSTSGVGATDFIKLVVGNNGATTGLAIETTGNVSVGSRFIAAQPAQFNINDNQAPGDSRLAYFGVNDTSRPANTPFINAQFGSTVFPYTGAGGALSLFGAAVDTGAGGRAYYGQWHNYVVQAGTGGGIDGLLITVTSGGTWVPGSGITGVTAVNAYANASTRGGFAFGADIAAAANGSNGANIVGLEVDTQYAVSTTGSKVGIQIADQLNNASGTSTNAGVNIAFQLLAVTGAYGWDTGIFCPGAVTGTQQCLRSTATFIKTGTISIAAGVDFSAATFSGNAWASPNATISGVGVATFASLTSTTIGNTNTVTLKDTLFTLQDDGDTTKQARFQLSGITTATTRIYTLPDASGTIALTAGATIPSIATGDLLYGSGVNVLSALADVATGNALISGGIGVAPAWGKITSSHLNITTTTCTNQFLTAISATGTGTCTTATLASAQFANQGTTTTVLHGNASGNPSFAAVSLTADVSGNLPLANFATIAANTVLGNATSGTAVPTALSMTSCSTSANAVIWTTSTGFGCNTSIAAATVTTNANLTGVITSVGNATSIASQTGTGTKFVVDTSPSIATPTFTTNFTSPLHIGGSGTTGTQLTFQTTSGNGTTDAFVWNRGNNGATLAMTLNNTGLGLGTVAPDSLLTVNANTGTTVAAPINSPVHIVGADGAFNGILFDSFTAGAGNFFSGRIAGGTLAAKTATVSGEDMLSFRAYAWDGSAYGFTANFRLRTAEAQTVSAHGSFIQFLTTPNGSTTLAESMRIQNSGGVSVGTATDPGIGSLQLNAQMFMPNITTSSAAQTGTVCWTTGTGKFTVDTTVGCLTSIGAAKNILSHVASADALDMIDKLDSVSFRYKTGYGDSGRYEQFGFVAEQVAAVDERLVGRDPSGVLQGVRYQELTAVLAGAARQLKADNDNLRAANDNLSARVSELENAVRRANQAR